MFKFLIVISFFVGSQSVYASAGILGKKIDLFKIDEIKVFGNKKVENEAILEKVSSRSGMILDNHLLKEDIEKIYSLKFFNFVEAHRRQVNGKNILTFKVKERPSILNVRFVGNDEISSDDLKEKVQSKKFAILDINTL